MAQKPLFLTNPATGSSSWEFRQDCMAWQMFTTMSEDEREKIISGNSKINTEEFRGRVRKCKAWYWLMFLTRPLIMRELSELSVHEAAKMKDALNQQREEIKQQLRNEQ